MKGDVTSRCKEPLTGASRRAYPARCCARPAVLVPDGVEDEEEGEEADHVDVVAPLVVDVEERGRHRVARQQREGQREEAEEPVARLLPEAQEEQRARNHAIAVAPLSMGLSMRATFRRHPR